MPKIMFKKTEVLHKHVIEYYLSGSFLGLACFIAVFSRNQSAAMTTLQRDWNSMYQAKQEYLVHPISSI